MRLKTILILAFTLVGLYFCWTSFIWKAFSCGFAGSYPCVEYWKFNVQENELIRIMEEIKQENPELQLPNSSFNGGKSSYFYHVLFYYSDTKEIVDTWIRTNEDSLTTTFAFVGISPYKSKSLPISDSTKNIFGLDTSKISNLENDFKGINRDFGYFENKRQITKFEDNILNLVKHKITQRQVSNL